MSLNYLSLDQAYMQLGAPASQNMVGHSFRIDHLTSERGRALNGKACRVVGFTANPRTNPDMRLQCVLMDDDSNSKPVLIKGSNLVPQDANLMRTLMQQSSPLSDEEIALGLRQGLAQHTGNSDRKDLNYRIGLYRKLLKKLERAKNSDSEKNNALEDGEYCFPCGATYAQSGEEFDNVIDMMLSMGKPACVGDNKIDIRLMDLGLKGDGAEVCSICDQIFEATSAEANSEEEALVTLPCVHMFHYPCIREWLQSDIGRRNWNCPTCRSHVPHNLAIYRIRYDAELRNRFQEFLLSGFCPKCILWVMERDRNQILPAMTESGEHTLYQLGV